MSSTHSTLWAPWRMEYIKAPKDHATPCVFCTYASHSPAEFRSDLILVATEHVLITLNRYPFTAGHLLLIPRTHTAELTELSPQAYEELFRLVGPTCDRLRKAVQAQALNVGINLGAAAGAGIAEHLHIHVVPRWSGDSNFMPVIADTRVMPQALDATWSHLYSYFTDVLGGRNA